MLLSEDYGTIPCIWNIKLNLLGLPILTKYKSFLLEIFYIYLEKILEVKILNFPLGTIPP